MSEVKAPEEAPGRGTNKETYPLYFKFIGLDNSQLVRNTNPGMVKSVSFLVTKVNMYLPEK